MGYEKLEIIHDFINSGTVSICSSIHALSLAICTCTVCLNVHKTCVFQYPHHLCLFISSTAVSAPSMLCESWLISCVIQLRFHDYYAAKQSISKGITLLLALGSYWECVCFVLYRTWGSSYTTKVCQANLWKIVQVRYFRIPPPHTTTTTMHTHSHTHTHTRTHNRLCLLHVYLGLKDAESAVILSTEVGLRITCISLQIHVLYRPTACSCDVRWLSHDCINCEGPSLQRRYSQS